jgi:hypothetical protein
MDGGRYWRNFLPHKYGESGGEIGSEGRKVSENGGKILLILKINLLMQ